MQLLTSQKKILGPVHLHPKTDKWDYLRSPIMKIFFVSCFDIGVVPKSPGKWNWNWLYFLPFTYTFEPGVSPKLSLFYVLQFGEFTNLKRLAQEPSTSLDQESFPGPLPGPGPGPGPGFSKVTPDFWS